MKRIRINWHSPTWYLLQVDDRLLLILISIAVGLCSGFAALCLQTGLETCFMFLHPLRHYWWAIGIPAIGASLSFLFLERIVKEGIGHGIPEIIYSVSRHGGVLKFQSSYSKLIASCLTIGSGGSAGPEAPVVMSGASIGSNIGKLLKLNERQRVTLIGCGSAGAIAAIFNAPIAGMVFSIEVILEEWTASHIVPIAIASVTGAELSRVLRGNSLIFDSTRFHLSLTDIFASIGLAIIAALASILLTRILRGMRKIETKISLQGWIKAALGGFFVGAIGMFYPIVLGEGYHSIQQILEGTLSGSILAVMVMCLCKILATSFTLGWGGSGGIFAPCLVIGSLVGLLYHQILIYTSPTIAWVNQGCFALLGMAGLISGTLQAPLTGIFLIIEITGGYDVIVPLIIVSTLSSTICHYIEPASLYFKELVEKGHLLRPGTDARILAEMCIPELLEKDCSIVHPNILLRDFINIIKKSRRNHFAVEDEKTGNFLGMIHLDDIRSYLFDPLLYDAVFVGQLIDNQVETVPLNADLNQVLKRMDSKHLFSMPVVDKHTFVGMISKATLLDKYRKELLVQTD
ncbi:MAG: chloride channel protein [Desulfobacterales bacterium]|nr:chloride channel protein [Desulfobacterales bacterium]